MQNFSWHWLNIHCYFHWGSKRGSESVRDQEPPPSKLSWKGMLRYCKTHFQRTRGIHEGVEIGEERKRRGRKNDSVLVASAFLQVPWSQVGKGFAQLDLSGTPWKVWPESLGHFFSPSLPPAWTTLSLDFHDRILGSFLPPYWMHVLSFLGW